MYYSVFIIMGQHFIMETLLSLDTGYFVKLQHVVSSYLSPLHAAIM